MWWRNSIVRRYCCKHCGQGRRERILGYLEGTIWKVTFWKKKKKSIFSSSNYCFSNSNSCFSKLATQSSCRKITPSSSEKLISWVGYCHTSLALRVVSHFWKDYLYHPRLIFRKHFHHSLWEWCLIPAPSTYRLLHPVRFKHHARIPRISCHIVHLYDPSTT